MQVSAFSRRSFINKTLQHESRGEKTLLVRNFKGDENKLRVRVIALRFINNGNIFFFSPTETENTNLK